jgi:sugar phosphate isomerase/epimerase
VSVFFEIRFWNRFHLKNRGESPVQSRNSSMLDKNASLESDVKPAVVIVASAFGADAIRCEGHAAFAAIAAASGAAGFEVRRELFVDETQARPDALRELGEQIRATGVWTVFSTPATLFDNSGRLDEAAMNQGIAEADALGARIVKFQLGGLETGTATDDATLARLIAGVKRSRAKVMVENGQLKAGGTIDAFSRLFHALSDTSHALSMTFDTANWLWAGEDPQAAARVLSKVTGYVHCKATKGEGARRFATAPDEADMDFNQLLRVLPRVAPRGIEFPFDPANLEADAARRVKQIAAA